MSSKTKPAPFIFAGLDENDDPIITDIEGTVIPWEEESLSSIEKQYEGHLDKCRNIDSIIVEWTNPTWIYIRGKKVKIGN